MGSTETKKVDFILVAATNAQLEKLIEKNQFREDLFFRLNVLPIHIKPLRERPEDIPILSQHFLKLANIEQGQNRILLESSVEHLKKPSGIKEPFGAAASFVVL